MAARPRKQRPCSHSSRPIESASRCLRVRGAAKPRTQVLRRRTVVDPSADLSPAGVIKDSGLAVGVSHVAAKGSTASGAPRVSTKIEPSR